MVTTQETSTSSLEGLILVCLDALDDALEVDLELALPWGRQVAVGLPVISFDFVRRPIILVETARITGVTDLYWYKWLVLLV